MSKKRSSIISAIVAARENCYFLFVVVPINLVLMYYM